MKKAIALARKGEQAVYPNPRVGAIIVENNSIISQGFHSMYGEQHAERIAIDAVQTQMQEQYRLSSYHSSIFKRASLYCTLEPCCGSWKGKKQTSCSDAIIQSGIRKVIIGMLDPNTQVRGKGVESLRRAGIEVIVLDRFRKELMELNEVFIHLQHQQKNRPFVHAKIAQSIDARVATVSGDSQWITGELSRFIVHRDMRKQAQAIIVGINTVKKDNPFFSVRLRKNSDHSNPRHNPIVVILDTKLQIPTDARLFDVKRYRSPGIFIFCSQQYAKAKKIEMLQGLGAKVFIQDFMDEKKDSIVSNSSDQGSLRVQSKDAPLVLNKSTAIHTAHKRKQHIDIAHMLNTLYKESIYSVLLETGTKLQSSFFSMGLIDKVSVFIASKIIGGTSYLSLSIEGATQMKDVHSLFAVKTRTIRNLDDTTDVCISGYMYPYFKQYC